jgi:hypothetical protein
MLLTLTRSAAGLALLAAVTAGCGAAMAAHSSGTHHQPAATAKARPAAHRQMPVPATAHPSPAATHPAPPVTTQPAPPATHPAPPTNPIPQHNGGDQDGDNNGGPSDGDGNI